LPGWTVAGVAESPITGPEGNKEFLLGATFTSLDPG
jgi:23S rRNA (cytidine1920-2'-O)/16S rRNA (cytidine1409-2'-O)-methyltransferase